MNKSKDYLNFGGDFESFSPPQVEMLVDLEEANTVEPVVATRKPVLERPTEEVLLQSLPFMLIIKVYYIILLITHGTYLPYTSRLISA